MSTKITEGQLDFLGLLNEYTDDQGATVRVREPRNRQARPMMPKIPERVVERDTDPEQMTLEMFQILPKEPEVNDKPLTPEKVAVPTMVSPIIPEKPTTKAPDTESKSALKVPTPTIGNEPQKSPKESEAVAKETAAKEVVAKEVVEKETAAKEIVDAHQDKDMLFKRCIKCWCYDCRHNARNEAVPRDICGAMMACPACEDCIRDDCATICEIGNAKEGCRLRASEEGIVEDDM